MTPKRVQKPDQAPSCNRSYEETLTEKQRRALYVMLRSEMPFDEVLEKAPPWGSGIAMGKQPSLKTLSAVNATLDLETIIVGLEAASALAKSTRKDLRPYVKGKEEEILDRAMELIGHEVIRRTISRRNLGERDEAAKLLLKRADQRRVDRRLDMLETEWKKKARNGKSARMTPEEKEERMKQIFGK